MAMQDHGNGDAQWARDTVLPQPGTLRSRIDAMSSMPNRVSQLAAGVPARPNGVRPSAVRNVLSQAALHMHLPGDGRGVPMMQSAASGPEYDRLRSTLKALKADAKEPMGVVGAQLAMESESSRVVEHVNAQVRAVQRAFGVLADTLEDEVGNLRAADAQQWEQLKVHATQFNEVEELKAELERTRGELRMLSASFSQFKADEHNTAARKIDELTSDLADAREQIDAMTKAHAADRARLTEEVGTLRRWRADVAGPFLETTGRTVANHESHLERTMPALQKLVEEIDNRTAKHVPELLHMADASARRQQALEEEGGRVAAGLARLGEAHTEGTARIEERLRLYRDESRTEAESHELRLRQAAAELEGHREAIQLLSAEGGKARVEAREEADTIATAVRACQASLADTSDKNDRALAALRADLKEMKDASEAASAREAQTLEGVLNLRTSQNQVSAWMEHMSRDVQQTKAESTKATDGLRELASEVETAHKARAAWKEELLVVDGRTAEALRQIEGLSADRGAVRELSVSMETFRREVRGTFEASQHAHNRLRELVEDRRGAASGGGWAAGGGVLAAPTSGGGGSGALWTSSGNAAERGVAAAREAEAAAHLQRRTDAAVTLTEPLHSSTAGLLDTGTRAASSVRFAGERSPPREDGTATAGAQSQRNAETGELEPPSRGPASSVAARSPPLARGSGPAAFTPSLWTTPAPPSRPLARPLGTSPPSAGLLSNRQLGSASTVAYGVSPALVTRFEPRRPIL